MSQDKVRIRLYVTVRLEDSDGRCLSEKDDQVQLDAGDDITGHARDLGRDLGEQVETDWHSHPTFIREP